jgi:hypothetical protein
MSNIVFRNNTVSGTKGGPDVYIASDPNTRGLVVEPAAQAPWWLKSRNPKSPQSGAAKQ